MRAIDLNCDLGEGFAHDAALMSLVTSANIACGAHAGDDTTMREAVRLAQQRGAAIGAHPGFSDRENFGRRELRLTEEALRTLITAQLSSLARFAPLHHVKPHGGLYNLAARDAATAEAVATTVADWDDGLILYALAGSALAEAGRRRGLRVAGEVFADRTYQRDGTLTPRASADALITDEQRAVDQVLGMVRDGIVRATDGTEIAIVADTICVHGDGARAVEFARRLNLELTRAGFLLKPISPPGPRA
ncbi:MAG: LamB/YcsF family protein [Verrucomicrobia bacterium]|nr:LamB/YcsF family protein [Verrucomicrobiota bacterium]